MKYFLMAFLSISMPLCLFGLEHDYKIASFTEDRYELVDVRMVPLYGVMIRDKVTDRKSIFLVDVDDLTMYPKEMVDVFTPVFFPQARRYFIDYPLRKGEYPIINEADFMRMYDEDPEYGDPRRCNE